MKTFGWLIAAGLAWLGLLQLSALLGFPPQLVTLARSSYIGTFSIFMMLELRRDAPRGGTRSDTITLRFSECAWYFVPLISVGVLGIFSQDSILTSRTLATIGTFYVCQLYLFFLRESMGQMRSAWWDLAPPAILAVLLLSPYLVLGGGIIAGAGIGWLLFKGRGAGERGTADALIMQLPSLVLAPTILIAFRDHFDFGGTFSRAQVETFGMVVNGVGAALWTATVMRASHKLSQLSVALWLGASICSAMLFFLSSPIVVSLLAILVAELFRGSLWLGTTHMLQKTSRWSGFTVNLIGTILPLAALWLTRSASDARPVMWACALFYFVIPVMLLVESNKRRRTKRLQCDF